MRKRLELAATVAGLIFIIAGGAGALPLRPRPPPRPALLLDDLVPRHHLLRIRNGQLWPNAVWRVIFTAIIVGSAYLITPYLKIGGQIYAASPEHREPDPLRKPWHCPTSKHCCTRRPARSPPSRSTAPSSSTPSSRPCPTRSRRPSGWPSATATSRSSCCAAPGARSPPAMTSAAAFSIGAKA